MQQPGTERRAPASVTAGYPLHSGNRGQLQYGALGAVACLAARLAGGLWLRGLSVCVSETCLTALCVPVGCLEVLCAINRRAQVKA